MWFFIEVCWHNFDFSTRLANFSIAPATFILISCVVLKFVQWREENPNPSVHPFQWETRLAEFSTGTVDPRVGIFLSLLYINDGFLSF